MVLDKNKIGLVSGFFLAGFHAVWSLLVLLTPNSLQSMMDWIFRLHSIEPIMKITPFVFVNALLLVVVTFVFGYIAGWVFSWIHGLLHKE